jgi:hypothetical protein
MHLAEFMGRHYIASKTSAIRSAWTWVTVGRAERVGGA